MHTLNNLLKIMNESNASDLHLTAGSSPRTRINGKLNPIDETKLSQENILHLLKEHLNKDQLKLIKDGNELDFTIGIPGVSRFRVNAFMQRANIVATFRRLPYKIPNIEELSLPQNVILRPLPVPTAPIWHIRSPNAFACADSLCKAYSFATTGIPNCNASFNIRLASSTSAT